jgi:hypothetical protein
MRVKIPMMVPTIVAISAGLDKPSSPPKDELDVPHPVSNWEIVKPEQAPLKQ